MLPSFFHLQTPHENLSHTGDKQKENSNQNGVDWSGMGRLEGPGGGSIFYIYL